MKIRSYIIGCAASLLMLSSCAKQPRLDISLSDRFEGQDIQLVNFLDSTLIAETKVVEGKAEISRPDSTPVFAAVMIDGRTRAFYVIEPGTAFVNDSTNSAIGTPLNDKFASMLAQLDSIEDLDDMPTYLDFVKKAYNENKNNPLGSYFGIEWIKYADLQEIDSLLNEASESLKNSPKTRHYVDFARLRDTTSPGKKFVDFEGECADGKPTTLAAFVKPGAYTLIDFWASWCPYCIKEIPDLSALNEKWKERGLNIVGVAVRDVPEDSKAAVNKHNITWPVMLNTQRRPYDIYGFSGIPHHILIGPDGEIISRGESVAQIEARLESLLNQEKE